MDRLVMTSGNMLSSRPAEGQSRPRRRPLTLGWAEADAVRKGVWHGSSAIDRELCPSVPPRPPSPPRPCKRQEPSRTISDRDVPESRARVGRSRWGMEGSGLRDFCGPGSGDRSERSAKASSGHRVSRPGDRPERASEALGLAGVSGNSGHPGSSSRPAIALAPHPRT